MTTTNFTTTTFRVEEDALGNVEVPADHLWGAQTQRSHLNFPIGSRALPLGPTCDLRAGHPQEVRGAGQW
jgi:hypothetical protein